MTIDQYEDVLREADRQVFGEGVDAGLRHVQCLLGALSEAHGTLEAAHGALAQERGDDDDARDEKERATAELSAILVFTRRALRTAYGRRVLDDVGLVGPTPEAAHTLCLLGDQVAYGLRCAPLGAPVRDTIRVDVESLADEIAAKVERLSRAREATLREKLQLEDAVLRKNAAEARFDLILTATGDNLASMFEIAGRPDLARKVKPSRRRRGMTVAAVEGPSYGASPPGAPSPAGPGDTADADADAT